MDYKEIIKKIKALEIQGAEAIAIAATQAFTLKLQKTSKYAEMKKSVKELENTRPTEPALRNSLSYCLQNYKENPNADLFVTNHFKKSKEKIAEYGAKKIHDGMKIFTHCHSSTVEAIIVKAWKQGKKFEVYNTETRPKFQGRKTATNLAKEGIPVTHFVDSAGRSMLRKTDLFLFGCDAITSEGKLINKIGTEMLAQTARESSIPAYSCTNSWKFDPNTLYGFDEEIEQRDPNEVWENPPKGVKIYNPAFEITAPDVFTGVITELGIYKPESLIHAVKDAYKWMFK
ncbi:S-methyl-5-thioribose-1-phosphate isomerase [bacterium]|nr:S-methyl-5-thioribose-1-phosphate isomerase [bacterium]